MRIQETDRILKEARFARQSAAAAQSQQEEPGLMSRAWRAVSAIPHKVTGLFRR